MILNYLFIGVVFMFVIDCIHYYFYDHQAFNKIKILGWKEKVVCGLIWPIAMFVFITAFLKAYFK